MPVHTIDLELLAKQVVWVANNDPICCRIEIDNVARTRRTAGQPLALYGVAVLEVGDPGRVVLDRRANPAGIADPGYNVLDDCIVARSDLIAPQRPRFTPKTAELQFLIAHHARVRRPARLVFAGEV